MKKRTGKYGLTLIEMLIVVGIIALLTAMIIGIARRIDTQSKERLAENTTAIINTALGQFKDYGYDYNDVDYRGFVFPLDCSGFNVVAAQNVLSTALGATVMMTPDPNINFTGCEVMYFLLSQVPECRTTLDKIDKSLITNKGSNNQSMSIRITFPDTSFKDYPLLRIIDPWKTTLRYDYYDETLNLNGMKKSRRTFPVIISAGPDKVFNTSDDIRSR
jgi:prepilin-type N-terminal cleavage/methylation domain-containing protein